MARAKRREHYSEVNWLEIVSDYHSGDSFRKNKATERACNALRFFIVNKMKFYYPTYIEKEGSDLIQSGYLGIIEHLGEYDPQKGAPTTFFEKHIHQAMQMWLNVSKNQSSVHYQTANNKIQAAIRFFEANELPYDYVKISEKSGVPISTIKNTLAIVNKASALEINEEIKTGNGDEVITPEAFGSPEEECIAKERVNMLYECIDKYLSPSEKTVILSLYGVNNCQPCSIKEIAAKMNISISNVKTIQTRALKKLGRCPELSNLISDRYEDSEYWLDDDISFFPDSDSSLQTAEFQISDFVPCSQGCELVS